MSKLEVLLEELVSIDEIRSWGGTLSKSDQAALQQKFGRYAMKPGHVYVQRGRDRVIWFLAVQQNKNGSMKGLNVVKYEDRRVPSKAKVINIPLAGMDSYKPVKKKDIPPKVIDRFEDRDGHIVESLEEAKVKRTYAMAKKEMLDAFQKAGWRVAAGLKIPHATSRDMTLKLWFRPQAIYVTKDSRGKHKAGNARSLHLPDLRKIDPERFVKYIEDEDSKGEFDFYEAHYKY